MPLTIDITRWINQQKISRVQILVLILCAACATLEGFDALNIAFVAPAVVHEWGLHAHAFTPAFMAGLAGLLIGCLCIAPIADKFGRKRVMLGSVIAFAVFSMLSAVAWSLTSLSILRFLTGVGVGGGMANAIALTSEFFPERKRASMTVIMFVGFPLGGALGGFLAAYLIPHFGWQSVFLTGGVLPILLAVLLALMLPESIRHLVVSGAPAQRVALILRRINPAADFDVDTQFVIEEEKKSGLTVGHLFREGRAVGTLLIWVVFFMSLLDIFLVTSWLPIILHKAGLSISMAAVVAAVMNLSGVVACVAVGPVVDRRGRFFVLVPAYLVAAIGIAALGYVGLGLISIMVAASIAGIGIVCGQDTANAYAAAFYPTYIRATGVGWALGIGRIGAVIGPAMGGAMLALHWSLPTLYMVSAVPELIAVVAIIALLRLERHKAGTNVALAPSI
jgi:AAHS family 4-hydroxybenzoate transporter-like MFS transporter